MDQAAFEANLKRDGVTEIVNREFPANCQMDEHTHDFEARILLLEGEITIGWEGQEKTYRKGDSFTMASGCPHTELCGPNGATLLVGRSR